MDIDLSNQQQLADEIQPALVALRSSLDKRKAVWGRLTNEQRRVWLRSGKDPVMDLAFETWKYLRDTFYVKYEEDA